MRECKYNENEKSYCEIWFKNYNKKKYCYTKLYLMWYNSVVLNLILHQEGNVELRAYELKWLNKVIIM